MSAEQVRETLQQYMEELLARGNYGRFLDDDIEFALMGTDQQRGAPRRPSRRSAFCTKRRSTPHPSSPTSWWTATARRRGGLVGTHIGDFFGVGATGNRVHVPYSVFYDVEADKIKALRIYMPMDHLLSQIGGASEPEVALQGLKGDADCRPNWADAARECAARSRAGSERIDGRARVSQRDSTNPPQACVAGSLRYASAAKLPATRCVRRRCQLPRFARSST